MCTRQITLALTVSAFCSSPTLVAAQDKLDSNRLHGAWEDALEDLEGVLTPEQLGTVNVLAYQAAVARVCDGFKLDHKKYADGVNRIVSSNSDHLDTAQLMTRHTDIVMTVGTTYGLFLAEGNLNKDSFCMRAGEAKRDKNFDTVWE